MAAAYWYFLNPIYFAKTARVSDNVDHVSGVAMAKQFKLLNVNSFIFLNMAGYLV